MIISETPLRISFAGGGTDLRAYYGASEGMVVSSAIDKYVYVVLKERFDDKIYINYSKKEIVDSVNEIEHGLVREAMRKTGVSSGVEITTLADIPSEGSGLGSSSSTTVGLLNALYTYTGKQVPAEQLAREACEIEIEILGKPIGKQDQYIAAYGGLRKIVFKPNEEVEVSPLHLSSSQLRELSASLLLFYTNRCRNADEILKRQQQETESQRSIHDQNRKFAQELEQALIQGKMEEVGAFLQRNWLLKKTLVEGISNNDIDEMYQTGMNAGAVGGKVCGAGGGGFLLFYVPQEKQQSVRSALKEYRELPFLLDPFGSRIIFNVIRYQAK